MKKSSKDGWIHVSLSDGVVHVTGEKRFFKGYAIAATDAEPPEDGVHVSWHWDGNVLSARSCHSGFLPLLYYWDDKQVVLATRLEDILRALGGRPKLDFPALGVLMRLGFLVGNRTPFQGISVLGPQGHLVWQPGARPTVTWSYPNVPSKHIDRAEARNGLIELFSSSIRKITGGLGEKFAVPLSGGRDSRHIALELHRFGIAPTLAITAKHIPPRSNEDARVAALLCDYLSWRHQVVEQPRRRYVQEHTHALAADFLSFEHSWTIPVADALKFRNVEEVFDGVGGDVLSAGLFQDDALLECFLAGNWEEVATRLLVSWAGLGGEAGLKEMCGEELRGILDKEEALSLIRDEVALHRSQPNPLKSFYFWNRSRRGTGLLPFKILGNMTAYAPYLDRELVEFLLALPPSLTSDKALHTEAIYEAYQGARHIPYENKSRQGQEPSFGQRAALLGPLALRTLTATRFLNAQFVARQAIRMALKGGYEWWKPRRVAYVIALSELMSKF